MHCATVCTFLDAIIVAGMRSGTAGLILAAGRYIFETEGSSSDASRAIANSLVGNVVSLAHQKYSSNVIEKVLLHGSPQMRSCILNELCSASAEKLRSLLCDRYANYVVQRALSVGSGKQVRALALAVKQ